MRHPYRATERMPREEFFSPDLTLERRNEIAALPSTDSIVRFGAGSC